MPPGTSIVIQVAPKERAQAARAFKQGMKLKSEGKLDQAYDKFDRAAELNPYNVDYITAREFTRQQMVMQALQAGNKAMAKNKEIEAMADFRRAVEYDPTNDFAISGCAIRCPRTCSRKARACAWSSSPHPSISCRPTRITIFTFAAMLGRC